MIGQCTKYNPQRLIFFHFPRSSFTITGSLPALISIQLLVMPLSRQVKDFSVVRFPYKQPTFLGLHGGTTEGITFFSNE